jgi:hypothetical protein
MALPQQVPHSDLRCSLSLELGGLAGSVGGDVCRPVDGGPVSDA